VERPSGKTGGQVRSQGFGEPIAVHLADPLGRQAGGGREQRGVGGEEVAIPFKAARFHRLARRHIDADGAPVACDRTGDEGLSDAGVGTRHEQSAADSTGLQRVHAGSAVRRRRASR